MVYCVMAKDCCSPGRAVCSSSRGVGDGFDWCVMSHVSILIHIE